MFSDKYCIVFGVTATELSEWFIHTAYQRSFRLDLMLLLLVLLVISVVLLLCMCVCVLSE